MAARVTRAVVVGASGLLGKELVGEFGDSAAAAWNVTLVDEGEEAEGQLTSANEEAAVIHALNDESLSGADLVFFTSDQATTMKFWKTAIQNGSAVIDMTGALESEPGFLVRSPWVRAGQRPDLTTLGVVTPHPVALLLALVSDRMERQFGQTMVAATVLEPASQAGSAGVDELHQQTVSLLSFQDMPKAIFDSQVAFNVQGALGAEARTSLGETRALIERHGRALFGGDLKDRLTMNLLQAPVFHGYTISALVQLARSAKDEELRSALGGGLIVADEDTAPSNQTAIESGDVLVSVHGDAGSETQYWLTIAADNLRVAARHAVAVALEMAALRPVTRVQ